MLRDPALLIWLDAPSNRKGKPNENLARELMELFTLGVGHYTEDDVKEAARALTGLGGRAGAVPVPRRAITTTARRRSSARRPGSTPTPSPTTSCDQPAAADRLAWRLCATFLGEGVADRHGPRASWPSGLRRDDLHVGRAVETILRSELFFSDREPARPRLRPRRVRRRLGAGPGAVRPAAEHAAAGRVDRAAGPGPVLPAERRRLAGRPGWLSGRGGRGPGELRRGPGRGPAQLRRDTARPRGPGGSARTEAERRWMPSAFFGRAPHGPATRPCRRHDALWQAAATRRRNPTAARTARSPCSWPAPRPSWPDSLIRRLSRNRLGAAAMLTRRDLLSEPPRCSPWPRPCRASCRGRPGPRHPSATAACWSSSSSTAATTASTPSSRSATRPTPSIAASFGCPTDKLLKVGDGIGLHPAMRPAADLLESGRLAIVQGVGYPNPNRSHFESMAIWQTARLDRPASDAPGWLGRALDAAVAGRRPGRGPRRRPGSPARPGGAAGRRRRRSPTPPTSRWLCRPRRQPASADRAGGRRPGRLRQPHVTERLRHGRRARGRHGEGRATARPAIPRRSWPGGSTWSPGRSRSGSPAAGLLR